MHTYIGTSESSFTQKIKNHLKKVMVTAKRRGAWFSLEKREKSLVYLAVRLDVRLESLDLLRALASVLKKLEQQGETMYAWLQRGSKLAWAFSEFAVACGNKTAVAWRNDRGYAMYLGTTLIAHSGGRFAS